MLSELDAASWFADSIRNYFGEHIAIYFAFFGLLHGISPAGDCTGRHDVFRTVAQFCVTPDHGRFCNFQPSLGNILFWTVRNGTKYKAWLLDWLIDWWDCLIDRLTDRLIDWLVLSFVLPCIVTPKSLLPPGWSRLFHSYIASFSL